MSWDVLGPIAGKVAISLTLDGSRRSQWPCFGLPAWILHHKGVGSEMNFVGFFVTSKGETELGSAAAS